MSDAMKTRDGYVSKNEVGCDNIYIEICSYKNEVIAKWITLLFLLKTQEAHPISLSALRVLLLNNDDEVT